MRMPPFINNTMELNIGVSTAIAATRKPETKGRDEVGN